MKILFLILSIIFAMATAQNGCVCPALYDPVCATSGQTYGNRCELGCAHATFKHEGACRRA